MIFASKFAEEHFARQGMNVMTNCRVQEVYADKIVYSEKDGTLTIWATGIKMIPFVRN